MRNTHKKFNLINFHNFSFLISNIKFFDVYSKFYLLSSNLSSLIRIYQGKATTAFPRFIEDFFLISYLI